MKLDPEDDECMDERENRNKPKPVFTNCNVCGRSLIRDDELAVGMCAICANEEITEADWASNPPPMPPHMEP